MCKNVKKQKHLILQKISLLIYYSQYYCILKSSQDSKKQRESISTQGRTWYKQIKSFWYYHFSNSSSSEKSSFCFLFLMTTLFQKTPLNYTSVYRTTLHQTVEGLLLNSHSLSHIYLDTSIFPPWGRLSIPHPITSCCYLSLPSRWTEHSSFCIPRTQHYFHG